jgi:hypothetical protein
VYLSKKTFWVRRMSISRIVSLWELSYFLKDIHPANHSFQNGANLMSFRTGLFNWAEEMHVSLERNYCVVEEGSSSTLFPCENWVSFWKKCFLQITVFKVVKDSSSSKWAYTVTFSTHMCHSNEREPFGLKAGASSTLFPCESWVSFWKQYFLQLGISRGR